MTLTRPNLSTACEGILAGLVAAFPGSIPSPDLLRDYGPAAKSRIGDLRRAGWRIETGASHGVATYRLVSIHPHEGVEVEAGCTIRHDSRSGWAARTHADALKIARVPEAVLREAEAAALAAYRAAIDPHLHGELSWLDGIDGAIGAGIAPAPAVTIEEEEEDPVMEALLAALDSLSGGQA